MQSLTKQDVFEIVDEAIEDNKTIKILKSDVKTLKSDVKTLKSDVKTLKSDVKTLKSDMSCVKHEQHKQGLILEDMQDNIRLLVEGVSPLLQKSSAMESIDQKILRNRDEITIVKAGLKSHMADTDAHLSTGK